MSFFGDIEKEIEDLITGSSLKEIKAELEKLASQVNEISREMERAKGSVHWTGAAADAFHAHAAQRIKGLHQLVRELDAAAAAAGAVVAL